MSEYIGPQVYPGGWKVISREEAELLRQLNSEVRAWNFGVGTRIEGVPEMLWWEPRGHWNKRPWVPSFSTRSIPTVMFFVKEEDVDD